MARMTTKLSDTAVKNAKPQEREYLLFDGDGLRLRVTPSGTKLWLFNYTKPHTKTRSNLSLGNYPQVSLAQARKKVLEAKELLAEGIDPKQQRDQDAAAKAAIEEHTFEKVAADWFERKKDDITEAHANSTWNSLALHVLPALGKLPVSQVSAPQVVKMLRPIEAKGSLETVKRLTQRINEIMTYAVNTGLIHANPLSGIKAAFKKPKKQNMAALSPAELPLLLHALSEANIKKVTRGLIFWQLHTMTRPNEAAGTRWAEIDEEARLWTIPAERMKMRREHVIPLSDEAMAILATIKPLSGHREYVFPSDIDPKTHTHVQTANMALKRMGLQGRTTAHGLRALASTTLNEQGFDWDVVEAALAHTDKNQVRSAYNRASYLERRREMMCWWSNFIQEVARGTRTIPYPQAKLRAI
ncbi:integrase domain-containing protein [Shewanella cyperi]|uniref:integrase domain-containing protein n=1 Tax=Shewanella cyperi TaxID=2814292 RepID=UPI001A94FB01|nr:integrase domain-containing protein [Shewanella cyperi]QSX39773.1 tyrosine-type recombinase/integrase [Shewanella cyperi]